MGMFSFECRGCGHPMLCRSSTDKGINEWMTDCVVLKANGDRLSGEYDGYGSLGGWDACSCDYDGAWWHLACWEQAGKPEYDEDSPPAADQGHFFEDGAHDMLEPGKEHPEGALEAAQEQRRLRRKDWAERHAFREAFEDASCAAWSIEDKERRMEKRARLRALKEEFGAFCEGQPDAWSVMTRIFTDEQLKDHSHTSEVAVFGRWFDAMKAKAQFEWLAERNFEVKHYVPGKTEASYGY